MAQHNKQKHIVVLGAGLVGIATAYALVLEGHRVSVIDKNAESALGASFANGGHIASGDALPWVSFDFVRRLLGGLWNKSAAATLHLKAEREQWLWLLRLLGNLSQRSWQGRARALLSLANFSQECFEIQQANLSQVSLSLKAKDTQLEIQQGVLHLFSARGSLKKAQMRLDFMQSCGVACELLQGKAILEKEPALTKAFENNKITTALFYPKDKTGDARAWTQTTAKAALNAGVKFHFNCAVQAIQTKGQKVSALMTSKGEIKGDTFVLALGTGSSAFSKHFGLHLPVYPVRGYSLTMDTNPTGVPKVGLVDERRRVVISTLGNKLRLAGLADIGLGAGELEQRSQLLLQAWKTLLPDSAQLQSAQFWSGERPMTPDNLPIIGKSAILDNLYLNTGHGALGWTLCHGSARLIADMIASRAPAIDTSPFSIKRF